jgi:hypothetical protein
MLLEKTKSAAATYTSPSLSPSYIQTAPFLSSYKKLLYSAIFILGLVIIAYTAVNGVIKVLNNYNQLT